MEKNYSFNKITNIDELVTIKNEWLASLTSPQDGMWAFFRDSAINWGIVSDNKIIGYAAVNENDQLLQFYLSPIFFSKGEAIFKTFIDDKKIKTGIVGTNNLKYLSLALSFAKDLRINSYLFRDNYQVSIEEKKGVLKECQNKDLETIVNFYNYSMGAPKEWLTGYIGGLIERKEIYYLEATDSEIIGACEVRRSISAPKFADIGMVVSPDFRKKGYGSYLLHKAKNIALKQGKKPICSCEKDNIGSVKSIHNCGFISNYQLLSVIF